MRHLDTQKRSLFGSWSFWEKWDKGWFLCKFPQRLLVTKLTPIITTAFSSLWQQPTLWTPAKAFAIQSKPSCGRSKHWWNVKRNGVGVVLPCCKEKTERKSLRLLSPSHPQKQPQASISHTSLIKWYSTLVNYRQNWGDSCLKSV